VFGEIKLYILLFILYLPVYFISILVNKDLHVFIWCGLVLCRQIMIVQVYLMQTRKKVSAYAYRQRQTDGADGRVGLLSQDVTYAIRHGRSNRRVGLDNDNLLQFDHRTTAPGYSSQTLQCADCGLLQWRNRSIRRNVFLYCCHLANKVVYIISTSAKDIGDRKIMNNDLICWSKFRFLRKFSIIFVTFLCALSFSY